MVNKAFKTSEAKRKTMARQRAKPGHRARAALHAAKRTRADKWDHRMFAEARLAASFSKDPSTKVGAVIANGRRIVSKGFNGFVAGMNDDVALYADRGTKYSRIIHGEMNALIFAERSVVGMTLYTVPFAPCDRCTVVLLQAGIRRFVFPKLPPELESRWLTAVNLSKSYMDEMGVVWVEVECGAHVDSAGGKWSP